MVLLDALSYTGVCNMLFSGFMCDTKWCAASGADCEVRESVLAADDRVRCEDENHIELQIASYIVIVVFAFVLVGSLNTASFTLLNNEHERKNTREMM